MIIFFQLAEISFRFYRCVDREGPMPDAVMNEWDEIRNRMEETIQAELKINSRFDYKDLCKSRSHISIE